MCALFPSSLSVSLLVDGCAISHSEGSAIRCTILVLLLHPLFNRLTTHSDSLCSAFQKGGGDAMRMGHHEYSSAVPVS